jgi:glycosyltransferase involved in cell wall biosynthesis
VHTFDIVIPTYNNRDDLIRCLASLESQTSKDFRVLVCVDGSTDGTLEYLASSGKPVPGQALVHEGGANRGRASTRNLAIPHVDSRYVLFLDSDMELAPDALARHKVILDEVACASVGSIHYSNADSNLWVRYLSARRLNRWPAGARLPFNQLAGAHVAVRTADFVALGGFDEHLVSYGGEDTEFGYRLAHDLGRPIVSNPEAKAISMEPKTLDTALDELRSYGQHNLRYIHARHPDMPHVFFTDRLTSRRIRDRLFVSVMNPLTDRIVDSLLPHVPVFIQHQLINYKVIRAVCSGYAESARLEGAATA